VNGSHVAIAGGVHIAALGGIWMMAVLGFAGLSLRSDAVGLNPHLPTGWQSLAFSVQWRGRRLAIRIDQRKHLLEATLEAGEPMAIVVAGERHELRTGHVLRTSIDTPPSLRASRSPRGQPVEA